MCFSASASFGAGVLLTLTGTATLSKMESPSQKPFAAIPLLFAAQQFIEGFLWLSFTNPDFTTWNQPLTYLFLIFAQVIWPFWVPFSIMKLEQKAARKKVLIAFVVIGTICSSYLGYCFLNYPVESSINGFHISYTLSFPIVFAMASSIFYFIPVVISPLVSSVKGMPILGMAIWGSYLFTRFYYKEHIVSVWCFLAAIMSVMVYVILVAQQKEYLGHKAKMI